LSYLDSLIYPTSKTVKKLLLVSLAAIIGGSTLMATMEAASAFPQTPGIDRREFRQRERIRHGIRDGSLTRREAFHLRRQQARIHRFERFARRDGIVTRGERLRLHRRLDRSSRNIYRLRHNRRSFF
jgi:hypothetical protein